MSRRIVQLTATGASAGNDRLYALDNNGVAWMCAPPGDLRWIRLQALPSIDNPRPQPGPTTATSLEQAEGMEP